MVALHLSFPRVFDTALSQLRYGFAVTFGRRPRLRDVQSLVEAAVATRNRLGSIGDLDAFAPDLDDEATRSLFERRLLRTVREAAETRYYGELFRRAGITPEKVDAADFGALPTTTAADHATAPAGFVHPDARPAVVGTTTGTTGVPRQIWFSQYEIELAAAVGALNAVVAGTLTPGAVVQFNLSLRAVVPLLAVTRSCALVGASLVPLGLVDPAQALAGLRGGGGSAAPASVWMTYPSYLGQVVTLAARAGMGPGDFRLQAVICGGEYLSDGLRQRATEVLGTAPVGGYGATELYPMAARECSERHLHFTPEQGFVEVLRLDGDDAQAAGELGELVVTPFPPYRETTRLLRYRTGDLVVAIDRATVECELAALPATSQIMDRRGRRGPRPPLASPVVEALESVPGAPLPVRCGPAVRDGATVVQVVANGFRDFGQTAAHLADLGVAGVEVVTSPSELAYPLRRRSELRETGYERARL